MSKVQLIEIDGRRAYVVPADLWERVKDFVEVAGDAAAYSDAVAKDDGVRIPFAVLKADLAGAHPVRAWREFKGITLQSLARKFHE